MPAHAADNDAQGWVSLNVSGKVAGPVLVHLDTVIRASADRDRVYEMRVGGLIGYRVSDKVSIWAGYAQVFGFRDALPDQIERRVREQVQADLGKIAGGTLASRTLLEQRFRDGSRDLGWRLRQQFKYLHPLRKQGKTDLVISHESFLGLNATDWGQQAGYGRMRNFIGLGHVIGQGLRVEAGYLNQHDFIAHAPDEIAHVAAITISYGF